MNNKENARIRRRVFASAVTTVVSITLVLFMLGVLGLLLLNARRISQYVKEHIAVSLTLKPAAAEDRVNDLCQRLEAQPYARTVSYITAEEAARVMQEELGEDFLDILKYNPLSPTIEITMQAAYAHPDSMMLVEKALQQESLVQEVFYQKALVSTVFSHIRKIGFIVLGFAVLLLLVAIALINNTIRLMIYARRFVIYNMQLVGATPGFIRRPIVCRGVLQGLVASVLASVLLLSLIYAANTYLQHFFAMDGWQDLLPVFAVMLVSGIVLCAVCTSIAVSRYLKISLDKLYY